MEPTPLVFDKFSGGFTDNYIDAPLNQYQTADNFFITPNEKLLTRYGSVIYDSTHHTVLASGNPRIGGLINYDQDSILFVQIAKNIYYNPSSWQLLLGPTSNACFNNGSSSSYMSYGEWNKHLFLVNDTYSYPTKIWKDNAGTTKLRTAGLPSMDLFAAMALANDIKAKYNLHIVDDNGGGAGSGPNRHVVNDTFNPTSSPAATDLITLITLVTELLTDYNAHQNNTGGAFHGSVVAAETLFTTKAPRSLSECLERLDDLRTRYVAHEANAAPHNAIGTQAASQIAISRDFSIAVSAAGTNYLYGFCYVYRYTVGNKIFEDFGPVKQVAFTKAAAITAGSPATISNFLPFKMANGLIFNWEVSGTDEIVIRIFRTINNGNTFYFVEDRADTTATNTRTGFIGNSGISGATTYVDGATDAVLLANNKQLYTNGGIVSNDQPPPAKFIHITDNFGYYGNIQEGTDIFPNRIRQSIESDIDSCPGSFFIDLEDELVGISSFNSIPIAFCRRFCYRLDGFFDDLGRGGIQALKIVDAPGCIGSQSIIQTSVGVFYAGIDGFYWTDGYRVQKISENWNTTYKTITSTTTKAKQIYGTYDAENRRVWWGIQYDSTNSDNDKFLVLDLRWGVKPDSCFTTISNTSSFAPTAAVFFNKELVRGDRRGYLFKHRSTDTTDPKIDTTTTPNNWVTKTIQWDWLSVATDFGIAKEKKFVPRYTIEGKSHSQVSLNITSINDDGFQRQDLSELRFRGSNSWGDPLLFWGDPGIIWGLDGQMEAWGRFPGRQLRCQRKQIRVQNSYTIIVNSDTIGTALVSNAANTATITTAGLTWPLDVVDYYMSFETDGYATQYLITAINSPTNTILTLQDASNTLPNGTVKWLMKGYRRGEVLELNKFTLHYSPLSKTQQHFTGRVGANA